jgi:hypothetical protein
MFPGGKMEKNLSLIEVMELEIAKWAKDYDGSDIFRDINDRFK